MDFNKINLTTIVKSLKPDDEHLKMLENPVRFKQKTSKFSRMKRGGSNCCCKRPRRPKYNACCATCPTNDECTGTNNFCDPCNKKLIADARDYFKPSFKRVLKSILTLFTVAYVFRDEAYCCRRIANSAAVYCILVDIIFKAFCHFLLKKYE